jgi:hypothetical protein
MKTLFSLLYLLCQAISFIEPTKAMASLPELDGIQDADRQAESAIKGMARQEATVCQQPQSLNSLTRLLSPRKKT